MEGHEGQQRGRAVFVFFPINFGKIQRSIDKVEKGHVHRFKLNICAGFPTCCAIDLGRPRSSQKNGRRRVDGW